MTENVRLQNLREFTVQIRRAETDEIVGTGIAVSTSGKIVTCRHVVEAAGVDPRGADGALVGVYFPQARGGEQKQRTATVEKFFPEHDDDIVLLQLTGGSSPLAPEQMPKLGAATLSAGHAFKSFGYRRLSNYQGLPATGEIVDYSDKPDGLALLVDPLMLASQHIDSGMSGSGVLDVERNLVVGIISETYESAARQKDRDTAFAVDNHVLTFIPFGFALEQEPFPLRAAPSPKTDIAAAQAAVAPIEKYVWNNAPTVLDEWTGRDELLKQLTADWLDPKKRITGLIGFGGEGKSSLARKWVELLLQPSNLQPVTGLFWWGFYENRSIDEFLEAALKYLGGGRIDPRQIQSSSLRAQIIGAMLGAGRYLFVLDGLEVAQHQDGDQYGLLQNNDLRDLLAFFARPDHSSFCLVTSRAPLLDLMDYTTYTHRDLERLLPVDGRALLERVGVKGSGAELDRVVSDWDGHALTLSLLGSYLSENYGGDIARLADIPAPTADEPRYERVHRVLRRYDEHLTETEREFLKLFSAFRTPVHAGAFGKVFVPLLHLPPLDVVPVGYSQSTNSQSPNPQFTNIVNRLVTYRILRHDAASQTYTSHPLVRSYYFIFLKKDIGVLEIHTKIKDYYLSIADYTPIHPTIDELEPFIEAVYHSCQAGTYYDAAKIYDERVKGGEENVIFSQLGAYETGLAILLEFLAQNKKLLVADDGAKRLILGDIGYCLMKMGRLRDAILITEEHNSICLHWQDWHNVCAGYQNLAEIHSALGMLQAGKKYAQQALDFASRTGYRRDLISSLARKAETTYLLGDIDNAGKSYKKMERLTREDEPKRLYLYSMRGIGHADYLFRTGKSDYARRITEANLQICEQKDWSDDKSRCHRVLGDIDSDFGNHASAHKHYETALKIARGVSARHTLIEVLLAHGKFLAKTSSKIDSLNQAFNDLNEALGYCVEGGYRIYEADVRVALGWAYLAQSEKQKAKESAARALQMSEEMGYYWGKLDAQEILTRILSL